MRIASRGSRLALWQARSVRDALLGAGAVDEVEVDVVRTTGDRILDVPLASIGDRGLFTKEIDEALLHGRADLAVHSLKDVPTTLPDGLAFGALVEREDARDVLICAPGKHVRSLADLPAGARIGTSALRRRAQLLAARPDLEVADIRGNLDTRLDKLDDGGYDALILAAAGILRLGRAERISAFLSPERWFPAVGQGALAVVIRAEDGAVRDALRPLHHPETASAVTAERALLAALRGGCQVPIGAYATIRGDDLTLDGLVADVDGSTVLRDRSGGAVEDASGIGRRLGERLLARGAGDILARIRTGAAPEPPPTLGRGG